MHDYLRRHLPPGPLDVLELGCGTGQDAVWLHGQGHRVLASDGSPAMLEAARSRPGADGVRFLRLDLRALGAASIDGRFDLVFSDFGALNVLSGAELPALAAACAGLLRPGGRLVVVVMPRLCLWELLAFAPRGRFREALRRRGPGPVSLAVGGRRLDTHYHAPAELARAFAPAFRWRGAAPIGLLVPPSFLIGRFARRSRLVGWLGRADRILGRVPGLAGLADHALVDLERIP